MKNLLIHNAHIVNELSEFNGSVLIDKERIQRIFKNNEPIPSTVFESAQVIDAEGKTLIPGVIDDQVHFREPGLTHKADIQSESMAAIAGGITSFMEMPNTKPQTTTQKRLAEKFNLAEKQSYANYSFYFGATNENLEEIKKIDPATTCGLKIFMGSSTGNMLVDDPKALEAIFAHSPVIITCHCEDEATIQQNLQQAKIKYGENIPISQHPVIRSEEACYKSSSLAVELANKHHARLHILHLSTAKEMELLNNRQPRSSKRITGEVCIHHLWFDDRDYEKHGTRIKWNPAVKTSQDREALLKALKNNTLDVIATDHAPHQWIEKDNTYLKAPSGGPMVQHALQAMLDLYHKGKISLRTVVDKMCHAPADLFQIQDRGYIKEGYWADLVLVDLKNPYKVNSNNILYKCGWSPMEGHTFQSTITHTFINGALVYENGTIHQIRNAKPLKFNR